MAITTGTFTNEASFFHYPSGTVIYACEVLSYPEISVEERSTTNHSSGGFAERRNAGLISAGDFSLSILSTPNALGSLYTDMKAKTERVCFLEGQIDGYIFTGWVKSVQKESADSTAPDTEKVTVTVTPVGEITIVNVA